MLNRLKRPLGANKRRKIVGRGKGSGHGKNSGRGNKGQWSRASGGVRPGFEGGQMPLIRRVPKRGFTFTPKVKFAVVALYKLNIFSKGTEVGPEQLRQSHLVRKARLPIKILGTGELNHALTVKANAFSKSALVKIKNAGGLAQEIQ